MHQRSRNRGFALILSSVALLLSSSGIRGQETITESGEQPKTKSSEKIVQPGQVEPKKLEPQGAGQQEKQKQDERQRAEEELKAQKQQRILGIIPAFNSSNVQNAAPLSPKQKFGLAFKTATDPFTFAGVAVDAGINQMQNDYAAYGQGVQGYAKRFVASYADNFNGTMLGNAVLPALLHQDPRYFRKGTGSVGSRIGYVVLSTVRCKGDNGRWQPSYSNILGNLAAGTISNIYYPESDRGLGLTFKRGFTVTFQGVIGATFYEFWPDITRRWARKHNANP